MNDGPPLLEARNIVKRFGTLLANDVESFSVRAGEVVALLGENGAGKSTLSKILYGYYRSDAGEIRLDGTLVTIASPSDARRLGIGMVFQTFTLIPSMTVWENVALFLEDLPLVISAERLRGRMQEHAQKLRLSVDPSVPVSRLAAGDRQKIEILKQLLAGARVLILDEPTKVLAPQEADGLFEILATLKADGYGIVFITHKLREVMACADRIAVMRQGRIVGAMTRPEASEAAMLTLMFGEGSLTAAKPRTTAPKGAVVLELDTVSSAPEPGRVALDGLSLSLRSGEILGVAGVSGNGQNELAELILGLTRPRGGTKRLWGNVATNWSVARIRRSGVASIPDDPLALAAIGSLTVGENLAIGTGGRYRSGFGLAWSHLIDDMSRSAERLRFPALALKKQAGQLSGGNLQRVVLARELAYDPKLIIALYPTRGLDTRSADALRDVLRGVCAQGAALLLVSEDLDELFAVCDRLIVLHNGHVAGHFLPDSFRADIVGPCMVGASDAA